MLGRGICGIGNAGITVLISTLIVGKRRSEEANVTIALLLTVADLVPIRDVAVWRGYVYAVNQVGRAIGPSLGGLIADRADWRW